MIAPVEGEPTPRCGVCGCATWVACSTLTSARAQGCVGLQVRDLVVELDAARPVVASAIAWKEAMTTAKSAGFVGYSREVLRGAEARLERTLRKVGA